MGQRGTAPLPDNVRAMRGTQVRKDRPQPVRAAPGIPEPPAWLPAEAKAEWKRVTPELHRLGLLAKLDRAALAVYCESWATWVKAAKALEQAGSLVVDDVAHSGIKKHPSWQQYKEAGGMVLAYAKELGLSPNSRQRMSAPKVEEADDGLLD